MEGIYLGPLLLNPILWFPALFVVWALWRIARKKWKAKP